MVLNCSLVLCALSFLNVASGIQDKYTLLWNSHNTWKGNKILEKKNNGKSTYDFPFMDPALPWETRLDDLIPRLTLEEIHSQTSYIAREGPVPAIPRLGIKEYPYAVECLHGAVVGNATVFPQSIGLSASFR